MYCELNFIGGNVSTGTAAKNLIKEFVEGSWSLSTPKCRRVRKYHLKDDPQGICACSTIINLTQIVAKATVGRKLSYYFLRIWKRNFPMTILHWQCAK